RSARLVVYLLLGLATASAAARPKNPGERGDAPPAAETREEKIAFAAHGRAGVPRVGIPGIVPSDGPNGIRDGAPGATAFPSALTLAASWDRALAERHGTAPGAGR